MILGTAPLGTTPFGAAPLDAAPPVEVSPAWARLPGVLGAPRANARTGALAWSALGSPLGAFQGRAMPAAEAAAALPSPLGAVRGLGRVSVGAQAALGSPLGPLAVLAWQPALGWVALPSPLGALRALTRAPRATIAAAPERPRPRLLADPLPLRDSTDLPSYRAVGILPWVYGRVTVKPLALDTAGLEWLLADHPIVGLLQTRVDGARITGCELVQRLDATGTPISVLRLTRAPTGTLACDIAGRPDSQTGALLEHPADIAADVLTRCGLDCPRGAWSALRTAYPEVALGGVLDRRVSLREALSTILGAVGAQWSAAPLRAWAPYGEPTVASVAAWAPDDVSAACDTGSLATRLKITWGWDWSAGSARGAVTVECPEASARYGLIAAEVAAPWLRTARDALARARAELAWRARPLWTLEVRLGPGVRWRPGDQIDLQHPWIPRGPAQITQIRASDRERQVILARPAGPAPRIETLRLSAQSDAPAAGGAAVSYRDGVATFTILNDLGEPVSGAAVTIDAIQTAHTDRQGQVQFRVGRGAHTLTIDAAGYAPYEIEVIV